jgi:glycosyltransferase involved in cell wall biosynthesis
MFAVNPFNKRGLNQYLSLSNKFFDYIHAGTPQVTMNYPEYRKINERFEVALLIDDLEPGTIAGALNKLLNDKLLYHRLRQNCLRTRQELCWQNEKQKLLDFYSKLRNE